MAIKICKTCGNDVTLNSEHTMLMNCNSPFIVRYKGVIMNESDLWVAIGKNG